MASFDPQANPYAGDPAAPNPDGDPAADWRPRAHHPALASLLGFFAGFAVLVGLALLACTAAIVFLGSTYHALTMTIEQTVSGFMPHFLAGLFVYMTPLGTILRGDFVVAAIILFVASWLVRRAASSLR